MRLIFGYQNTKDNDEDLALTPYLFLVRLSDGKIIKVYGIGVCWFHFSFYTALGFNIPKSFGTFVNHSKRRNNEEPHGN